MLLKSLTLALAVLLTSTSAHPVQQDSSLYARSEERYNPMYYYPRRRPEVNIGNVQGFFGANSPDYRFANAYWNNPNGPNARLYSEGGVQRFKDAYGNDVVLNGYAHDVPCPSGEGRCQVA